MAVHKIKATCPICERVLGDDEPVMYVGPGHTLSGTESMVAWYRKYMPERAAQTKVRLDGGVADRFGLHPNCWQWLLDHPVEPFFDPRETRDDHTAAGD